MLRQAVATAVVAALAMAACGGGDDDDTVDASDKRVRQGASASLASDVVWVVGGSEGRAQELVTGEAFGPGSTWALRADAVGYALDGTEVARVTLGEDAAQVVEAVVADVAGRPLLVAGSCAGNGFGCNGPTTPLVGWLDDGGFVPLDLDSIAGVHAAELVGVAGDAAWVLVDDDVDSRLVRVDAATGAAEVVAAPEGIWTGDVCAGPDGLVSAVSELNDQFVAVAVHFWTRGLEPGDGPWTPTGALPMGDRRPGAVRLHCAGEGEVVLDLRDLGGPVAVRVDGATIAADPPDDLDGAEVVVASDPGGGLVAATIWDQSGPAPVVTYRPGVGWTEVGRFRPSTMAAPVLAVAGGAVYEVGGAAVVEGVGAQRIELS